VQRPRPTHIRGRRLAVPNTRRLARAAHLLDTLMPTSPLPSPTLAKNVVMAASSSASASTPGTPTTSMFHW
jgi:hypothetical protein